MTKQQIEELKFWDWHIHTEIGVDKYKEMRENWLNHYKERINIKTDGLGLEVGTGCYSMFNGVEGINLISIDPLNDEYQKIFPCERKVKEIVADGEHLDFETGFDYIVCFNVIDHTPDPFKLSSEIKRLLKKGGRFYFEVNFDDELGGPHYELWNKYKVKDHFGDLKQVSELIERNPDFPQSCYYAEYTI